MDINDVRGLSSIFSIFAFIGIFWWAYGSSRKKRFNDDAQIPFMDDDDDYPRHDGKSEK